jgi:hypothetical protein
MGTSKISGVSLHANHTITRSLSKSGQKACSKNSNAYESVVSVISTCTLQKKMFWGKKIISIEWIQIWSKTPL